MIALRIVMFLCFVCTDNLWAQIPHLDAIPQRRPTAITGTAFAHQTAELPARDLQQQALAQLRLGNIPHFLRQLQPVCLTYKPEDADTLFAVIYVTPDYLAIGSDDDFLRLPLSYPSAIAIANAYGCVLPTTKIVDAIHAQAACRLAPEPLSPGPHMRSMAYFLKHRQKIRAQLQRADYRPGDLVAGHKKDVVLTNRLHHKPGRIAIYGWHRQPGDPIQPLSTVHGAHYADYSHGIRLVHQTVYINGNPHLIFDVLKDPVLAPLLSDEGVIANPRILMGRKAQSLVGSTP